jgi:hypothetical protein
VLVSRKIQHTAELDCRQRGLRHPDGRNPFAETATFLPIISLQEGRLIAEPRIAVKIRSSPSVVPFFPCPCPCPCPCPSGKGMDKSTGHGDSRRNIVS